MARLWGRRLFLAVSWLFVACVIGQVYLAGIGVFGGGFDTHRNLGYAIGLLPIVMFVVGLIGRVGRLDLGLTALLFVQGILQTVFVLQRESGPTIAALHPVNGVLMLIVGIYLAYDSWRLLRARSAEPATEPTAQA